MKIYCHLYENKNKKSKKCPYLVVLTKNDAGSGYKFNSEASKLYHDFHDLTPKIFYNENIIK